MRIFSFFVISLLGACALNGQQSLAELKSKYNTKLQRQEKVDMPLPEPPDNFQIIQYVAAVGELPALVSIPENRETKYPAIIWLVGGFSNSISDVPWSDYPASNDQSASTFWKNGVVTMYPALRGGNNAAGYVQSFYGEVADVIAAAEALRKLDYVDPNRIYLGGHSTGGTLALLVAESTDKFRAVFSLGPVADPLGYGQERVVYDGDDQNERYLRAPALWMQFIKTPTFVFEGESGNSEAIDLMEEIVKEEKLSTPIHFYVIKDHDHFNIIQPLSRMIVSAIQQDTDTGAGTNIQFTGEQVEAAVKADQ